MARPKESSIVSKCALIMDTLGSARQPLPFSEIVARTGFVKSSCHRILAVLQSEQMIEYDSDSRTYFTGSRLQNWAPSSLDRHGVQEAAAPIMDALSMRARMNAALSALETDCILYLRTSDYVSLRFAARAGDRAPLHCTAAGKMFLAAMEARRRAELLALLKLEAFTEFTKTNPDELEAELESVAAQGFAVAVREEYLHVVGVCAPIRNGQSQVIAGLSLWAQTDDATPAELMAQAPDIIKAAEEISRRMGWRGDIR
ncbi:IclR family transcriptional regulator [Gymnodinialimonas sp. 2305UL16-5]|uniref:IclR family transcriptional regulator n=1 Tax=Gymnodinialimonas mytili TaxID=3126503 RepID=UPI0030B384C9